MSKSPLTRRLLSAGSGLLLATVGLGVGTTGTAGASTTPMSISAAAKRSCAPLPAKYPAAAHKSLLVGLSAGTKGITTVDVGSSDGYTGLNPDLAEGLGQCLGDKIKFVNFSFDGLIPGLVARHTQLNIGGQFDTPEREKQVNFIDYLGSKEQGLVQKGNPHHVKVLGDLCGLTVAEVTGLAEVTIMEKQGAACKKAGKAGVRVTTYTEDSQVTEAVISHRADFELNTTDVVEGLQQQYPSKLQVTLKPFDGPVDGIEFQKSEKGLMHGVQAAMGVLQKTGFQKALMKKYLAGFNDYQVAPTINGGHDL